MAEDEGPVSLQLFGDDADIFRRVVEDLGEELAAYRALDINMGCPAPKIVKTGAGSALLKTPEKARTIIEACVEASPIPSPSKSARALTRARRRNGNRKNRRSRRRK